MRNNIFYFMHIDWDWIKQRPHFIAEYLTVMYDVIVVYPYSRNRTLLTNNERSGVCLKPYTPVPFRYRNPVFYEVNRWWVRIIVKRLLNKYQPAFIWLTHPELIDYLPDNCRSKIIYDCMDDALAFDLGKGYSADRLLQLEHKLITQASLVVVSSQNLANIINKRQYCKDKLAVIHNAFGGKVLAKAENMAATSLPYKIGYIGTVASWFDMEALLYCLDNIQNVEFHIIGPVEETLKKAAHPRMKFYGAVKHDDLYSYVKDFACMIMPFKVNELVRSVDPVKLYEYINYNKPIISVYYPELDRFAPYVTFYSNKEELKVKLHDMIGFKFDKKYADEQRESFLQENSWESRIQKISSALEEL